ncbi:RecF/RecN/SMC N terminal domain-containing protein [Formivibrio citricus]|uniref:RecF/RecN/SMC N terminal domain-containing protein n=1 Tax=Formivibrio citricus TaxID=83765 RepID=A0A1I5C131_9NEIS|nr:AAA family ATPase [Formivibrio citricus]SFN80688.1 RecF/RecN/SMC N terminal domain-containing protein [Formivibrio citricus]
MFQIRELEMIHWDFWQAIKTPLDAQIVTIVGPNGSGKTTLLDALRTLLALKCSGRRDYKRYVRNNRENFAWLRGVVSNPKRPGGGLFPYLFFPATTPEITLFCRIRRQGGDWMRQYAIAEGNVALTEETENAVQWLGVNEYKRRLEQAGLTPAIAEVLALEQGDTDKLCEYSPKALLDLVFQVFGDKQVLDNYAEAKLRLKEAEGELERMTAQLSQLGHDVEALRARANRYLEWQALKADTDRLANEIVPALKYVDQWGSLAGYINQFRGARKSLRLKQDELDALDARYRAQEAAQQAARQNEEQTRIDCDAAYRLFVDANRAAGDTEKTLKDAERLRELAASEHGADAVALSDRMGALRGKETALREAIKADKDERQQLAEAQFVLQSGQQPNPVFVSQMRAALDEAGIPHQLLTEIVEVRDPAWQEAVEALLAPFRHIVLLARVTDKRRAWEIGQRLKYRHFIVPDREPVEKAAKGSVLEVVDFKGDAPGWLIALLNRTQRVKSIEAGSKLDSDWITPEGFHKERRGGRDISVKAGDFAFGEAARKSRLNEIARRLRELNSDILERETEQQNLMREIAGIQQQLMGMQAVVQLASRQEEFTAAAERFPEEKRLAQETGAALAAAQTARDEASRAYMQAREAFVLVEAERRRLDQEVSGLIAQLTEQRAEQSRRIRELRDMKRSLPAAQADPAGLRALREQYGTVREVQHMIERQSATLESGDWETDSTIILRRDKLIADYAGLERDVQSHRIEVERTAELTDDARSAYINKLKATVRAYGKNLKHLGELAGIGVETDMPHLENDDTTLAQAGLVARFDFDQKGMMGMNDGEASGGQQVMKSLILLIGLMMDESNPSGFVFIDEPFAHLDIFNIDRVGAFLKATQAQYLITTPLTHNTNVYAPSELTLTTRKKRPGETWAPLILQTRRRCDAPAPQPISEPV